MRQRMLPLWPELVPTDRVPAGDVLGVVGFDLAPGGARLTIPIRQLGAAPVAEVWRSALPTTHARCGDVSFSTNGSVLLGTIAADGGETEVVTRRLYEQIVDTACRAGYPYLLRVWNHVGAINDEERDVERYKRFSAGRHEALTGRGFQHRQFPAASAVGMVRDGVTAYFIASRAPGEQVENPRQVAAYDYPPAYGTRSPSFARATVAQWNSHAMIFVSGTASVVGHETRHEGDLDAQVEETLRNMETIVGEAASRVGLRASLDDFKIAKTYIRRAADYATIAPLVTAALPGTQLLFMESDICRRNLLLEIEGVATL
jgi:chorismate lyase / 3-hydroxybenzoate synthase